MEHHPVFYAFMATLGTWGVTALGAALVFFFREINKKFMDSMLGLAAGVMLAASYWSLLAPAIEMSEGHFFPEWFPACVGFLAGGGFLFVLDKVIPHLHSGVPMSEAEGPRTGWHRSVLLVLAITLHNIPEGLAVGVAFGATALALPEATLSGAITLAVGIAIQNFPEGLAVSAPLRREGMSRLKSFWYGQLSGVVEPIAGVIGALVVSVARPVLPYALSFAAGAMVFVVVEELIPEAQRDKDADFVTVFVLLGFALMMVLDVGLG